MKLKEFLSIGLMLLLSKECFAASSMKAPVKTNKNEITIEFNDNIENRASLDLEISEQRNAATSSIGSGAVMEVLALNEGAVSDLKSIDANSLEGNGREARSLPDNTYFNDFETDYTKPGSAAHNTDADEIVTATEKSLQGLTEFLRKNGIDCNEVSKSAEVVDPYYIEIERSEHKEVDYDLRFCEYPRNTYNCQDSMTMRCEKKGMLWGEWQHKTIRVPGPELLSACYHAFYSDHVAGKIFEMKLFAPGGINPTGWDYSPHNSVPAMKEYLARRHGVASSNVGDDMSFAWEGGVYGLGGKGYAWHTYVINYRHREGREVCEQWSPEKWSESCGLK